jgi:hypothetical protein
VTIPAAQQYDWLIGESDATGIGSPKNATEITSRAVDEDGGLVAAGHEDGGLELMSLRTGDGF